jgi:phage gpG-like protein
VSKNTDAVRVMLAQIHQTTAAIFEDVGMEAQRSIVEGSELTGAPGQPVDTGNLKTSWTRSYDSPTRQTIGTNVVYAPFIEDGVGPHGPLTLRSTLGGFHSIAHTLNRLQNVLDVVTKRHGGR